MRFRYVSSPSLLAALALAVPSLAQITTVDSQLFRQGADGLPGNDESGDRFGQQVAAGDFDGDGLDDLAIGTPQESGNRGIVYVLYSGPDGLRPDSAQTIEQGVDGIDGNDESGDAFGWAVEAGDFDGDGFDDLAVGAPGEDGAQGVVHAIYGSSEGLTSDGNQVWRQDQLEGGGRDPNDQLGFSLAVGDFNGDGIDDLAAGSPGERIFSGLAHVIYGSSGGLTETDNQRWRQSADDVEGSREDGDFFAFALAAGDFDGDGIDDLAIGVPGEDNGRGQIQVLFGTPGRLTGSGSQRWRPGEDSLIGDAERGDRFGEVMAAGDLNGDGRDDLAFAGLGENNNGGEVILMYGSESGPAASGAQQWIQGFDNIPDTLENGDRFGSSLEIGDVDGDGLEDLAVGVRGEDANIGVVHLIFGAAPQLDGGRNQAFAQGIAGIPDEGEPSDDFGFSVAIGDFGRGPGGDLAIGAPGEDNRRGVVHVLYGETLFGGPMPTTLSVVGAGLSVPPVQIASPNAILTAFGANFAEAGAFRQVGDDDLVDGRVPTNLEGVCVEMNGRRAPVFGVFAVGAQDQINFQSVSLPTETTAEIVVVRNCGESGEIAGEPVEIAAGPVAPEYFFFVAAGDGVGPIAAVNETTGQLVGPNGLLDNAVFEPAAADEAVTLFMTGLGETDPRFDAGELPSGAASTVLPVRVTIGGIETEPLYAGVSPGFAGLYQVSFAVPPGLGSGAQPVVVTIGDVQPVTTPPGGFIAVE